MIWRFALVFVAGFACGQLERLAAWWWFVTRMCMG